MYAYLKLKHFCQVTIMHEPASYIQNQGQATSQELRSIGSVMLVLLSKKYEILNMSEIQQEIYRFVVFDLD